jgi:arylsulfatase A-like enzyme
MPTRWTFLFALAAFGPLGAAEKPNIIVVLADDLGYGDLSCYGGQTPTKALDRMAQEGTRLTQFYVAAPICSPSRCALVTGQFPGRWRITSYLQTKAGNRACGQADYLDPKAPSLPRALKEAGYKTAHIGKWHLGGGRDVTDAPKFAAYGYDLGLGSWESPEPAPELGVKFPPWAEKAEPGQVPRHDRTRWMVDRTLQFLKDNRGHPCFVNLWFDDTHTPFRPSPEQRAAVPTKGDRPQVADFKAVLVEMDRQIGRLLDGLREQKLEKETLVLFFSDNGPLPTFDQTRAGGLRGSKLSLYEGGIREPFIAWWPGRVPAGRVNRDTVLHGVDLFPTLCRVAGVAPPGGVAFDGEDLSAALFGKDPARTKPLFWEYGRNETAYAYPKGKEHRSPTVAVRDGKWKLLVNADGAGAELYDVVADPKETRNLAAEQPDVSKRLTDKAVAWRKSLP